jgi:uncharacterized protein
MTVPDNGAGFDRLRAQLQDDAHYLTPVETHGLLCAMAVHPDPPENWPDQVAVDSASVSTELVAVLRQECERLAARLGGGDGVQLPCRLDPQEDNEGADLASWCAGFMAGVLASREDWPDAENDDVDRLLPFVLIAGLDDDPELDELWQHTDLVRQMASSIPALVDELFLAMRGLHQAE